MGPLTFYQRFLAPIIYVFRAVLKCQGLKMVNG